MKLSTINETRITEEPVTGTIYLIHFDRPYKHARHYLGYCHGGGLDSRIARHRAGCGARLLQVLNTAGIGWKVVRTWEGDRALERRLKNWKNAPELCPICTGKS